MDNLHINLLKFGCIFLKVFDIFDAINLWLETILRHYPRTFFFLKIGFQYLSPSPGPHHRWLQSLKDERTLRSMFHLFHWRGRLTFVMVAEPAVIRPLSMKIESEEIIFVLHVMIIYTLFYSS